MLQTALESECTCSNLLQNKALPATKIAQKLLWAFPLLHIFLWAIRYFNPKIGPCQIILTLLVSADMLADLNSIIMTSMAAASLGSARVQ